MLQYTDPSLLELWTKQMDQQITVAKLDAVEKLLWGHVPRKTGKADRGVDLNTPTLNTHISASDHIKCANLAVAA